MTERESQQYFEAAQELEFDPNYLAFAGYDADVNGMKLIDFRGIFQRKWLSELFLNNIENVFYAIDHDEIGGLIQQKMITMFVKITDRWLSLLSISVLCRKKRN